MAEADFTEQGSVASKIEIQAAAGRIENLFHVLAAMHDLCCEQIGNPGAAADSISAFVLLRELLRGAARDAENCAEALSKDGLRLGFFEGHFGRI